MLFSLKALHLLIKLGFRAMIPTLLPIPTHRFLPNNDDYERDDIFLLKIGCY